MKQASEKQFKCTVCDRWFTRIDHLKRHQLRHRTPVYSAAPPSRAAITSATIIKIAPSEGTDLYRKLAKEAEGVMLANQKCTSMKLRCDGGNPCGACMKRNLACTRQSSKPGDDIETRTDSTKSDDFDQTYERGSVKFLLNGGTDSFTRDFHLPSRHDRPSVLPWSDHNHNQSVDHINAAMSMPTPLSIPSSAHAHNLSPIESQPVDVAFYNDNFVQFFNGGYNSGPRLQPDTTTTVFANTPSTSIQGLTLAPPADQQYFEPESPYSMALIQSILSKSWSLGIDELTSMEISQELRFLLTNQRIQKFISLYFQNWQSNCPMIHQPTFSPETATPSLLAAVVFMGAMYSDIASERLTGKKMLDLVETFIFSTDVYSHDFEIAQSYKASHAQTDIKTDWGSFQNLQAGYLLFLIQYWGGTRAARSRMVEIRLGEILKVARRMQLTKCRHDMEDQMDEYLWLQKECRIRTMVLISMIDSAMSFYQNYPPRMTNIELQCDLPCQESHFAARHPFLELDFRPSREMTVYKAFHSLFIEQGPIRPLFVHPGTNKLHLGIMDMFLLIHQIYSYIHMHMNLSMPLLGKRNTTEPESTTVTRIKIALEHWRSLWISLRTEIPQYEWEKVGFFKGAYNFWLVSQLLISKNAGVDILMRMEVNCDDKLSQLKVLLPDDND
ncbi:hypothetical protein AJ79_07164 [Helicocarpus griseus UAMH5409]|uniref:C2H2-type domain-containing protein n=1 Tax=Helicocarpus griseus UAMH5409 TaxID=1447875 RepID=A0A2B7X550_9EURO|nr:hypothetical protein AJ79_07164 [Helicocarpus griseus UAMH5409]